ncbi:FAD/NAD(P)-binding protein [Lyngbya confervoides]|uniref:Lysine N(6)-hydroxylase/L-ornithine N(5)-oxygenase family protein n=1 Tax=Lyngbya confervoides BDU141951 TaxID=1574623 RepID=A0ABD4T3G2_9CYAN|nr:FAD/NAD(P)-binding protein [Lyngbya confervoides]MCM1983214.1 lysine N(6)-hydroxylase/L-ornithine N(5)-oxygenase family protein [Lyngbya confervoides BDU141951]
MLASAVTASAVTASAPATLDIAIVGAGPQALTLVTHLIQKRKDLRQRFQVFDPSGTWMQTWQHQFEALEIPHLRSPAVHHPDPHAGALRNFAEHRAAELHGPYGRPGTQLFYDFCQDVIRRWDLGDRVYPARVEQMDVQPHSRRWPFRLRLDNGQQVRARRVVLAMGSGRAHTPAWTTTLDRPYPCDRLRHAQDVDLRQAEVAGQTVLIIGSGLTSGHLAIGAVHRGARVLLMARRQYREMLFDADPGWLGPKYLKGFAAQACWEARHRQILAARNGGSLTPEVLTQLRRLQRRGQVTLYEQCQVQQARWQAPHWQIHCQTQGQHVCLADQPIDHLWLATGQQTSLADHPLLQSIQAQFPAQWVNGWPVLDEHLRWPGCELFVMGAGAALQLGPVARNLAGARMACDRIVPALAKPSLALSPTISQ